MDLSSLFSQASNAQSGGLLGGGVFSPRPPTRAERREGLLADAINRQGTAAGRAGAAVGGLIGTALSGIGPGTPEEQRNEAIRQVQQETAERGLDPVNNRNEFKEYVQKRFTDLGQPQLAQLTGLQLQTEPSEPVETTIRAVGGTDRAKALAERFPDIGQIEEGQEFSITLSDGEFRSVDAGAAPKKESAPSRIREYELALERGLIDPSTSLEQYNSLRSGGQGVSVGTGTQADRNLLLTTLDENEDLTKSVRSLMDIEDPVFFGFGGGPVNEESIRLTVVEEARNIREDSANRGERLTPKQAIEQAVENLRSGQMETAPQQDNEGPASPQNDRYADMLNP